jgi:dolichol-phosphate mannosyltransferase
MASVSVVIPTFNERESIGLQVGKLCEVVPNLLEIIVVDDDSPDGTGAVVRELGRKDPRVRLIRRTTEKCLASAIQDGVLASRGEVVLWLDCDHDPHPRLVSSILASISDGADVATASRYVSGGRELREPVQRYASMAINFFARLVLDSSLHDYTTGFVASRRLVFDKVGWTREGYGEYCIEFLYKAVRCGFNVREVPFVCTGRTVGESKTTASLASLLKLGVDYGVKIIKLRFSTVDCSNP